MERFLDKISSYNLLNNLLPGVILCFLIRKRIKYSLLLGNSLVENLFVYYFIGIVVSRFGSVVVEPICKKLKIITFMPYDNFVLASYKDPKVDILSETNNTYRTFLSLFIVYGIFIIWNALIRDCLFIKRWQNLFLCMALIILFALSYNKQINYINRRIKVTIENEEKNNCM
ncbi:hypothetical protein EQM13_10545 [Acidilutibacter cellobiosedens]|uniref:Uncharacterized protein n=1 Tax=Acidilutibacter cellobiosedens TaxID=2507161 RepID=A0A410QD95_9FIRM|nr:hypothetical protein [Acidilutibacter cellobiosedens]QAT61993.1 hypothetical protein EQM13_10545 [Acidilutibacter cellobiosedens]